MKVEVGYTKGGRCRRIARDRSFGPMPHFFQLYHKMVVIPQGRYPRVGSEGIRGDTDPSSFLNMRKALS